MARTWKVLCLMALLVAAAPLAEARAHETDHYTFPAGRELAEFDAYFTAWAYDALADAVDEANVYADAAAERGDMNALYEISTEDFIFDLTWRQFPNAYFLIENVEAVAASPENNEKFPGRVSGYKTLVGGLYTGAYQPFDPRQLFRVWHASVIRAHGTYFGSDKVGHFTDMGKNYYLAYRESILSGASEAEAHEAAIALGTDHPIYSEGALLGSWSAGAYSNGDLAANYAGFLFYRNLTEPVLIDGHLRPPLLEWDGQRWSLAPHVRRDSDFLSYFITDHWDEALNPSVYELSMRQNVKRNILDRVDNVLWRYRDVNGNARLPMWFVQRAAELSTYDGRDYGHRGDLTEVITLAEAYEPVEPDAPLDARNARGFTALHDAAAWGEMNDVRALLERGADINARVEGNGDWASDAGCTALHLAARAGHRSVVQLLLAEGASLDKRDRRNATVTHHAAGHPEILAILLEAGAPVEGRTRQGRTVLHWAAAADDDTSVRILLDRGARPNHADAGGETPLHLAARHASAQTIAALTHAADPNASDRLNVRPLHVAVARRDEECEDVVRVLLMAGADPNAADSRGRTTLHEAARTGRGTCLAQLVTKGGDVNAGDAWGTTPLHLASRHGRNELAQWLVDQGAAVEVANAAGITPLHEAAFGAHRPLVARLVRAGADPAARDAMGRTPAAVAASRGRENLAQLLNDRPATIRLADQD